MSRRAVFIDRDGVIVRPVLRDGIPKAPFKREEFAFYPDVARALAILRILGFLRILVTNQPDVAHGYLAEEEWRWMQASVEELDFDDVYICRHIREDGCECKKPKPGMLFAAAKKWGIDIRASYMIGDTVSDTGAAQAAGCKSILIRASYNESVRSDYVASSLYDAVLLIKRLEGGRIR